MTHSGNTSEAQVSFCFLVKNRNNYQLQIISDPERLYRTLSCSSYGAGSRGRIQLTTYSMTRAHIKKEDNLIGKFQHLTHILSKTGRTAAMKVLLSFVRSSPANYIDQ